MPATDRPTGPASASTAASASTSIRTATANGARTAAALPAPASPGSPDASPAGVIIPYFAAPVFALCCAALPITPPVLPAGQEWAGRGEHPRRAGAPKRSCPFFVGLGTSIVPSRHPRDIEQVRTSPGRSQPCPGDTAACSMGSSFLLAKALRSRKSEVRFPLSREGREQAIGLRAHRLLTLPNERARGGGLHPRGVERAAARPAQHLELSVRDRHGAALRGRLLPREALQRRPPPALLLRRPDLRLGALVARPRLRRRDPGRAALQRAPAP